MTDKKEKLCIMDAAKAKIDDLKSWAKRNKDELYCAGLIVGTGIGCAAMGFIAGRFNGYLSGVDEGMELGVEIGKFASAIAEKVSLAEMDEKPNENVK